MEGGKFPGKVSALRCREAKAAAEEARKDIDELLAVSIWSDRFSLDSGRTGAGVAWKQKQEWRTERVDLCTYKEVFDTELYSISEALNITLGVRQSDRGRPS